MKHSAAIFATVTVFLICTAAGAKGGEIKPSFQFEGSVQDVSLIRPSPDFISNRGKLQQLWDSWQIPAPMPEINFKKHLVTVCTWRGNASIACL